MADDAAKAHQEMKNEFTQFRDKGFGKIAEAFNRLENLQAEDDLYGTLLYLEDQVKACRTGGVFGEGAGGHRRARDKWQDAANPKPKGP